MRLVSEFSWLSPLCGGARSGGPRRQRPLPAHARSCPGTRRPPGLRARTAQRAGGAVGSLCSHPAAPQRVGQRLRQAACCSHPRPRERRPRLLQFRAVPAGGGRGPWAQRHRVFLAAAGSLQAERPSPVSASGHAHLTASSRPLVSHCHPETHPPPPLHTPSPGHLMTRPPLPADTFPTP